ncbi:uncharacterized protein P884DRAFT_300666 [Thermothelomyces heterothallicus CBS 202.75]|uniref:uncharacterized protein n=1 Tax=Thermothelomyces heterothallicus CBS 202.75 TaxID=1149848 RepID=UPI0037447ED2
MTSSVLLRICFVSACANTLFKAGDAHSPNSHKAAVVARRTTRRHAALLTYRLPRRSLATLARPGRQRRILRKTSHSFDTINIATKRAKTSRRDPRESKDMDEMVLLQRSMDQTMRDGASTPEERHHPNRGGSRDDSKPRRFPDDPLSSPTSQMNDLIETRSVRSASTASRSTNRLSLTLPIVPATAYPSRTAPASAASSAFPPTPLDTPAVMSPVDPNDFITAIAAQERRVLELKEELNRAESDLARLKRQWATHEAYKKRANRRNVEPLSGLWPAAELQDETAIRRSIELDRRKALLTQQNQQPAPEKSKRRVFTGSHTRTLSLLSPTKPTGTFSSSDDEPGSSKLGSGNRYAPAAPTHLAKRATWAAARSTQTTGVKQLAEDLKTGLWTFMEDLRQATVGDEPITGQGTYMRSRDSNMRSAATGGSDQDTIRASANSRPRVQSAFDEARKASETTEQLENDERGSSRSSAVRRSKTDATTRPTKRFSWTPLTVDSYDDNDWSNWDSPSTSSPRWSGTTVNGDIIPSIPEKRAGADADETENATLKKSSSKPRTARSPSPPAAPGPSKLEDLLPQALNKLSPSNIKRSAVDFMKEWERSLSSPAEIAAAAAREKTA